MSNNKHFVRPDDPKKLEYFTPSKITIGDSPIHNRGIFATDNIVKGEVIERCPMIQMEYRSKYQIDPQVYAYMYAQPPCSCDECNTHGFLFYMVLGYGMMYNHKDNSNALWKFNYSQLLGDVIAIENIFIGQEIFVNYGNAYFNSNTIETGKSQIKG